MIIITILIFICIAPFIYKMELKVLYIHNHQEVANTTLVINSNKIQNT